MSTVPAYRLAPHVHACRTDDHVVLLDLRRDKYLAVGGWQMDALAALVDGWPVDAASGDARLSSGPTPSVLERMATLGLVTTDSHASESTPRVRLPVATVTLADEEVGAEIRTGIRDVSRFLASAIAACASLRYRSFESIVRGVAKRKARRATPSNPFSLDVARRAVEIYERLRPLVFTSRDACLFDSLALVNFLAASNIFPSWVVGVKTGPFAAHSWVQAGEVVLNDLHERVRKFTPILVV